MSNNPRQRIDTRMRMSAVDQKGFNPLNDSGNKGENANEGGGFSDGDDDEGGFNFDKLTNQYAERKTIAQAEGRQSEMRRTGVSIKNPLRNNINAQLVLSSASVDSIMKIEESKEEDEDFDMFKQFEKNVSMTGEIQNNLHIQRATERESDFMAKRETSKRQGVRLEESDNSMRTPPEVKQNPASNEKILTPKVEPKVVPKVEEKKPGFKMPEPTFKKESSLPFTITHNNPNQINEKTNVQLSKSQPAPLINKPPQNQTITSQPIQQVPLVSQQQQQQQQSPIKQEQQKSVEKPKEEDKKSTPTQEQKEVPKGNQNQGFQTYGTRMRSPMNLDSNAFNKNMLKNMYSSGSQIEEKDEEEKIDKQKFEDELSDTEDQEYKNYSLYAQLETVELAKKLQTKVLKTLNAHNRQSIIEDAQLSEEDFIQDHYFNMHLETLKSSSSPYLMRKATQKLEQLKKMQSSEDFEDKDVLNVLDWNERRHQEVAKQQLIENSVISLKNVQIQKVPLRLVSDFTIMQKITNNLIAEKQYHNAKATCIAVSDELIFIGTSEGSLMMFDRETEELYETFTEKSKEFIGNTITALDVHITRTDYVVIGYEKGQMVLIDVTEPKKSLKVIKDHHKGVALLNLKFCEWNGGKKQQKEDQDIPQSGASSNEDKQLWMFISIDNEGRVIVNTVKKVVFMYQSSKHVIIDPNKISAPMFTSLAARFEMPMYAQADQQIDGTLIALGNTETVYILKIRPNFHAELFQLNRPLKYQSKKEGKLKDTKPKLPSLCWGYGHTPVFKDKSYSILAIGWGPLIQLVVVNDLYSKDQAFILEGYYLLKPELSCSEYISMKRERIQIQKEKERKENKDQAIKSFDDDEDNKYQNNESIIYQISSLGIEQLQFLSESTLMVMTEGFEVRILYTELFYPNQYQGINNNQRKQADDQNNTKRDPVLENDIILSGVATSEYGAPFHQTLKLYKGLAVVITQRGLYKSFQFNWVQSLVEFKKFVLGDWIQVFAKALEFYRGKIKGFLGVPEDPEVRENSMKADLKLLIRDIIQEMVAKFNVLSSRTNQNAIATIGAIPQMQAMMDDSTMDINEHLRLIDSLQDKKSQNYQTLIRIAIEFCVELKDCYFLFYDLFLLFQEEHMEKAFIEELEPFIIAGKFSEWELPDDILQKHIINFYKDHSHPENLEKVIINLNLKTVPKQVISELNTFCENHFLSTAILFLNTQALESKQDYSCVEVFFRLFDLYKKAGKVNTGSAKDIQQLRDYHPSSSFHRQTEKSQVYLGYKILWVIKLFLGGHKFPSGLIKETKWRTYIHDIIQFISTKDILITLLKIDAEAFFQIISVLFFEGKPCEYVKMGRAKNMMGEIEPSMDHSDLLRALNAVCYDAKDSNEEIKMQYLFFAANIASKCKTKQDQNYYFQVALELLKNYKQYLKFNEHLLVRGMERRGLLRQMSYKSNSKVPDGMKHVLKSEDDLISIIKMCEPLQESQIKELQMLAERTTLNQVQIFLFEKQENYLKCLQLFLGGMKVSEVYSSKESKARVFQWIRDKLKFLQDKSSQSGKDLKMYEQFKKEITYNIKLMIDMDSAQTVLLIDEKFTQNHKELIDTLAKDPNEQLAYLEALLKVKEKVIQDTIREYSLQSSNPQEAKKYMEFMKQHLRLCCQLKTDYVIQIIEELVKQHYYPTDECLKICQEYKQTEACALLNKKLGQYYQSVQQYLLAMKAKVNMKMLKYELHEAKHRNWTIQYPINNEKLMPNCTKVDLILKKVTKICKKNSKEVDIGKEEIIWYEVLDTLFELKQHEDVARKKFCREFFEKRINLFTIELVGYIPFKNFIEKFASKKSEVKFLDLKGVLYDIFNDFKSEKILLKDVKQSIFSMDTDNFRQYNMNAGQGILFRQLRCLLCKKLMDGTFEPQQSTGQDNENEDTTYQDVDLTNDQLRIFSCKHTFHDRCVNKFHQLRQIDVKVKSDKQKCPECNKKNFDLEVESPHKLSKAKSEQIGSGEQTPGKSSVDSSKLLGFAFQKAEGNLKRQLQKIQKKMESYDQTIEADSVSTKNFRREEQFY